MQNQGGSSCTAHQHFWFCYTDITITLHLKSENSRFLPSSVSVLVGLLQTWLETLKTGFLVTPLKLDTTQIIHQMCNLILSCRMGKPTICIAVTVKLISAFVFITQIVQFLYFLQLLAIFCTFTAGFVSYLF